MKATEIKERSTEDLQTLERELRVQLFQNRIKNHTNQLDSTAKLRTLRRDIARIATVLRQRELQAKGV